MTTTVLRTFYIDVSGISVHDIPSYMDAIRNSLAETSVVTSRSYETDALFIPVKYHSHGTDGFFARLFKGIFGTKKLVASLTRVETQVIQSE